MAFIDYTPLDSQHDTIPIPDDAEMQTSGVAAFNSALEALADNSRNNGLLEGDSFVGGGMGGILYTIPSDTSDHLVSYAGTPIEFVCSACKTGNLLHVTVTFPAYSNSDAYVTRYRLLVELGMGNTVIDHTIKSGVGFSTVTLQGMFECDVDGAPSIFIDCQLGNSGITSYVYAPINITVTRRAS